jgi:hypothetical protein
MFFVGVLDVDVCGLIRGEITLASVCPNHVLQVCYQANIIPFMHAADFTVRANLWQVSRAARARELEEHHRGVPWGCRKGAFHLKVRREVWVQAGASAVQKELMVDSGDHKPAQLAFFPLVRPLDHGVCHTLIRGESLPCVHASTAGKLTDMLAVTLP